MMRNSIAASFSSFFIYLSFVNASETSHSGVCQEYSIPVNVTSEVSVPNFPPFKDNFDVVGFVSDLAKRDSSTTFVPFSGTKNTTASYSISATVCNPRKINSNEKTLLLASPGLGYDRRYWDSEMHSANYSFVEFATDRGYSVFFYDRLGTGKSSIGSGYNESQASTQLAILQQLTVLVRAGHFTGSLGVPSKVVHVGHSFGSYLSNALISTMPELSDAAVLTGISYNGSEFGSFLEALGLRIANDQAVGKWNGRDSGYLTGVDAFANAAAYFYSGSYDKEMLWYTENMKQPTAIIEALTDGSLLRTAPGFTGPVMIISGEFDFAVCGGDCKNVLDQPARGTYFPNATDFQAFIHPGVGHVINFSHNATGAYGVMLDYLKRHGL